MLKECLADVEARIDVETEERLIGEWKEFLDGDFSGELFSPTRGEGNKPKIDWPSVSVNDGLGAHDKMLTQQIGGASGCVSSGAGRPMGVRANFGTGILSSVFGASIFVMDEKYGTLPTTESLPNPEDTVKALLDKGVPDLNEGYGAQVFEAGEFFTETMADYPRIQKYIHIYHPDLQGPMDICELLWGSELFIALVDKPDLVKSFLDLITETYIAFLKRWHEIVPPSDDVNMHWSFLHKGAVALRNDSIMNLSPDMYTEFARPYDQRILDEFGGGVMHFCGRGDHYIDQLAEMPGMNGVAMSQPQCNDMEKIYCHTVDKAIPLLGFNHEAAEAALASGRDLHHAVNAWTW